MFDKADFNPFVNFIGLEMRFINSSTAYKSCPWGHIVQGRARPPITTFILLWQLNNRTINYFIASIKTTLSAGMRRILYNSHFIIS
jgi:hypothetical protein